MASTNKTSGVSLAELSRLVGRHRNTVAAWVRRGCPTLEAADRSQGRAWRFDPPAVVRWLETEAEQRGAVRVRIQIPGPKPTESTALERKRAIEAELLELELQKRRGAVIDRDDVVSTWSEIFVVCRNHLRAIPKRLLVLVPGFTKAMAIRMLAEIDDALNELARSDGLPRKRQRRRGKEKA